MKKVIYLFFFLFIFNFSLVAQAFELEEPNYHKAFIIEPIFSVQFPGIDFKDRFGVSMQAGLNLSYKFSKNWYLGGEGDFLFSGAVKETKHVQHFLTNSGLVITKEGYLDEVNYNLRGGIGKFFVGKSFYFRKSKPENGILIRFGLGYINHKILIDVNKKITPQLTKFYARGYDRMTHGFLLSQYFGLIRLQKGQFINLSLGVELTEAFTKGLRPYDFYLGKPLHDARVDFMFGIKLNWMIPVFIGESSAKEYYTY